MKKKMEEDPGEMLLKQVLEFKNHASDNHS